ncbi:hypothetical protein B0H13DRAFT_2300220 [Mycena leptocephala]|nr:hypothetical protein B0H13DRAFT_2300220 [Mycena leptocephala]
MSSKFYMNSMLATLNSRQHVRLKGASDWLNSRDALPLPAIGVANFEGPFWVEASGALDAKNVQGR